MSDLIWLSAAPLRRIEPHFPLWHGVPRDDDRRVISGIIFVISNGLRWRDAPKDDGPHKTIYNRLASPPFGSFAGAGWECLTAALQHSRPRAASPTG